MSTVKKLGTGARCGDLRIVQLLVEQSASEVDATEAFLAAASNGHQDVVASLALVDNADFDGFHVRDCCCSWSLPCA